MLTAGVFIHAGRYGAGIGWLAASSLLLVVAVQGWAQQILYLPPVVFSLLFLAFFASSLLPGRQPVVTEMAIRMGEQRSARMFDYTRRVTIAWCAFFAGLAALSTGLALWSSPGAWSWFVNLGSYLLVGAFFVGEFILRGRFLPGHRFQSLSDFVRALLVAGAPKR